MTEIKLYIEFHWGKRRPSIELLVNNQILNPIDTVVTRCHPYQENAIITYHVKLMDNNKLDIIMSDKTDADLIQVNDEYIDHWVKIRELEVDGIKFETCLYNACSYQHSMSDEWVKTMLDQGYVIEKEYAHGTDMRLNGIWSINFSAPIWQWCVERYNT